MEEHERRHNTRRDYGDSTKDRLVEMKNENKSLPQQQRSINLPQGSSHDSATEAPYPATTAVARRASTQPSSSSSSTAAQEKIFETHNDQVDLEFIVKMSIACVVLVGFMAWFAWTRFCRTQLPQRGGAAVPRAFGNGSRTGSSGRRRSSTQRPLQRTSSLDSSFGTVGSMGSSGVYQRDARDFLSQQDEVMEFVNPLWTTDRQPSSRSGSDDKALGESTRVRLHLTRKAKSTLYRPCSPFERSPSTYS